MTISFDLDDTLIPGTKTFETEKQTIAHRLFGLEKIRLGTIELFKELRDEGHRIYIYTTSFRSTTKIKLTFYFYGIPVDAAINQQRHDRQLRENKTRTSKFPPAFDIDVHVDDSLGLRIEGERFNFKTIIVDEHDKNWGQTILKSL
jgi:FMN phosphatase YigB (HAD superfamily)